MFYSQEILQRRGGKFGIIWIAATKSVSLTKKDYSSVNVRKMCIEIMNHIFHGTQPTHRGTEVRARFSLYLSSQLMYGVVRVYAKQREFLLDDCTNFSVRVKLAPANQLQINLAQLEGTHMCQDINHLMSVEGAHFDPLFGRLTLEDPVAARAVDAAPVDFINQSLDERAAEVSRKGRKSTTSIDISRAHTARKHEISIVDNAGDLTAEITDEPDLAPLDAEGFGLLNQDVSDVTFHQLLMSPGARRPWTGAVAQPDLTRDEDVKMASDERQQLAEQTPMYRAPFADNVPATPVRPMAPCIREEITMITEPTRPVMHTTLDLSSLDSDHDRHKRKRKRRMLFYDGSMMIPKEMMRSNMVTSKDTCAPNVLSDGRKKTAEQLMQQPGSGIRSSKCLFALWKQCANRGGESNLDDSSGDVENIWTVHLAGTEEGQEEQVPMVAAVAESSEHSIELARQRLSAHLDASGDLSREVLREQHSGAEYSKQASSFRGLTLEQKSANSTFDDSEDAVRTSELKRQRQSALRVASSSARETTLEDIYEHPGGKVSEVELGVDFGEYDSVSNVFDLRGTGGEAEQPQARQDARALFLRQLQSRLVRSRQTTFRLACAHSDATRGTVARSFYSLLSLAKERKVLVNQEEAFGDIFVSYGVAWDKGTSYSRESRS